MVIPLEINNKVVANFIPPTLNAPLTKKVSTIIPDLILEKQEAIVRKSINGELLSAPVLADFKVDESKIRDYVKMALALNSDQSTTTQEALNQMVPGLIEEIIREGIAQSEKFSHSSTSIQVQTKENTLDISEQISPFLFQESFVKKSPKLEIAVVGANILSRGSSIVALGMLLNKIQDAIETKKTFLESVNDGNRKIILQNEVDILTRWLELHSASYSNLLKDNLIDTTFSLPKATAAIISLKKAGSTLKGMLIGWLGMGVGLVGYAYDWKSKQNSFDKHEMWTKIIDNGGSTANQIVARQQNIFEERLKSNLPVRDNLLNSLNALLETAKEATSDEKLKVQKEVLMRLKDAGITLPEEPTTLETLQAALSNPVYKDAINVMMVKKKEMLSVSLRNSLKAFNQKKDAIDRGFLENTIDKSSGFFILYAYITGWSIALEAMLASGVFTSAVVIASLTTILSILSYGTLAGLVVSVALGSIYLYLKKPNIFKTYVHGVQAKLAFWNIPLTIQRFRKNCALLEEIKVNGQVHQVGMRIFELDHLLRKGQEEEIQAFLTSNFPNKASSGQVNALSDYKLELEKQRKSTEEEWKVLNKKVSELSESVTGLENRVKPLQEQIEKAGWKDFQIHLYKDRKFDLDQYIELTKLGNKPKDEYRTLAEYLLQDPSLLEDSETKKVLMHIGIDLSAFLGKESEEAIEKLSKMIRSFFAMETDETKKMISNHKLLEAHGLRENIPTDQLKG